MSQKHPNLSATSDPVEEPTRVLSETIPAPVPSVEQARPSVERRAFARRRASGKVIYQIGDWGLGPSYKAEVVDISQNGIGLVTNKSLAVGTLLRVLRETPYRGQKVAVMARVRWVTAIQENQFRVGCNLDRRLLYTEMQSLIQA
jgi:hypothetical protein